MQTPIKVTVESPSNIAIVKYWGKKGHQLPMNASMSFTLSEAKTIMEIHYTPADSFSLEFLFEGNINSKFEKKIEKKLMEFAADLPFILKGKFQISSRNTFPHSTGIASSASAMSALAFGISQIAVQLDYLSTDQLLQMSSHLARIGSGSASRSLFPYASVWGENVIFKAAKNEYAIGIEASLHPLFKTLHDAILIVDDQEKSVSSTVGHELMNDHPHRESRLKFAEMNLQKLVKALSAGDFATFAEVSEHEALDLHSMMMTSTPSYILLAPESLAIINKIREFRTLTQEKITFTIDAGPNIHVLYPLESKEKVELFLETLYNAGLCKRIIKDRVGTGSQII